jgi:hypothetical protein
VSCEGPRARAARAGRGGAASSRARADRGLRRAARTAPAVAAEAANVGADRRAFPGGRRAAVGRLRAPNVRPPAAAAARSRRGQPPGAPIPRRSAMSVRSIGERAVDGGRRAAPYAAGVFRRRGRWRAHLLPTAPTHGVRRSAPRRPTRRPGSRRHPRVRQSAALRTAARHGRVRRVHSLFASHAAKRLRRLGRRASAPRAAGTGVAVQRAGRRPPRPRLGATSAPPRAGALRGARAARATLVRRAGVASPAFLRALYDGGIGDLSGARPSPTGSPAARSPRPRRPGGREDDAGRPARAGLSLHTRNPANAFIVPALWVAPRVRAGWAGMSAGVHRLCGRRVAARRADDARPVGRRLRRLPAERRPVLLPRLRPLRTPAAEADPAQPMPPAVRAA